jgi:hypothetical protein
MRRAFAKFTCHEVAFSLMAQTAGARVTGASDEGRR